MGAGPQDQAANAAPDTGAVTLETIRQAAETLRAQVVRTPLVPAFRLSRQLGCELFLKCENFQVTGSFKDRGACNKLMRLDPAQARRGVIAMSAGNHAQGVAYHAQRLGIPATIVMPEFAPFTKVQRTRAYGARVVQVGDTLDVSAGKAREIAEAEGLTFVHPYDDPAIVAGQGTIGLEILADAPRAGGAGGADWRRRPDLRHRHGGQGAQPAAGDRRRRGGALPLHAAGAARRAGAAPAAPHWPTGSR